MSKQPTYILLNAGNKTRGAFASGIQKASIAYYKTKEMLLHIQENGNITFFNKNTQIDLHGTHVFTRLRATDAHFCGMLYEYFDQNRIPTNDPINRSYPHSAEKISQMMLLALAGIRIPPTMVFREESYHANREYIASQVTFPLIFKTDGSKGINVHLLTSLEELDQVVERKLPRQLALIQPFIENTFDTRTLVAYGEVLGSIKRTRTSGYLNNIGQGAIPAKTTLTQGELEIALAAAKACSIDLAGVDMIHTDTGPVVLEVNKSPQVKGFESVHEFKVFTRIAEIIAAKFKYS